MNEKHDKQARQDNINNNVTGQKHNEQNVTDKKCGKCEALQKEVLLLKKQIEEQARKIKETEEKPLRLMAELSNYKKRVEEEKEKFIEYAGAELIKKLLVIIDNLESALDSAKHNNKDAKHFIEGVELIYKDLINIFEKEGLIAQKAKGNYFDPLKYEAVQREERNDSEDGIVLEELRKGYEFKGKVLRHAMVKVARKIEQAHKAAEANEKKEPDMMNDNGGENKKV